jgi:DNA invertase Pin-like site-specific DNA recombinase
VAENIIGHARVSTRDQDPQYQEHALADAGASRVFTDHGGFQQNPGPPPVGGMSGLQSELAERGINLRSLTDPEVDTTTPMGKAHNPHVSGSCHNFHPPRSGPEPVRISRASTDSQSSRGD